ncbi:MAG TPA: MFS transporter [Candidatus Avidesulfovibrio excrementigallinarum]|nr:MFS transporter [Candidatus Avidesulfovibrio excrementigallinarum]
MDKKKIVIVSMGHLACDINSGALPAILPFLIAEYGFGYKAAAGLMFAYSCLSSVIQPVFGYISDKMSKPWFMLVGVMLAGGGLASVGFLHSYWSIFFMVALSGTGAALFHPEGARFANKISGQSKGTGMSLFSIGGNGGFVLGPLVAVFAVQHFGMPGTSIFGLIALITSGVLFYQIAHFARVRPASPNNTGGDETPVEETNDWKEFSKLTLAIVSRSILFMGMNTFIPLYWINVFGQSKTVGASALTVFCTVGIASNIVGGMLSDRFGYLRVIRGSFILLVPCIALFGFIQSPALAMLLLLPLAFTLYAPFSAIVVLGQKYLARNIGFASGVTLGLATSMGGIIAPLLGWIGDHYGLPATFQCMTLAAVVGVVAVHLLRKAPALN